MGGEGFACADVEGVGVFAFEFVEAGDESLGPEDMLAEEGGFGLFAFGGGGFWGQDREETAFGGVFMVEEFEDSVGVGDESLVGCVGEAGAVCVEV